MSVYDETIFEIWRMDEKRTYYLMSAAGAGIGYSLATMQPDMSITQSRLLLMSLVCWALSFVFGHKKIVDLKIVVGSFSMMPNQLQAAQNEGPSAQEELRSRSDALSNYMLRRSKLFSNLQYTFLMMAAAFIVFTRLDLVAVFGISA
ncbi:hypothetical protein BC777_3357 [Yoonia maricola]|uniref:Uncharacterized protein n=1 Tax=Yoonia maricola TaxID=420999 RepID=A0A2M8W332_9RHOB|nr:hypothetical protein [Yoonia maricola]PJI85356.1 hypothetical protein BC777_3357 [Yoonia maricola]